MALPVIKKRKRSLPAASPLRPSGEKGFTLLEMMIALFILTVSILGMTSLTLTSIQANHQNDLRNTAIKLTSEIAEILLTQPSVNIVSGGLTPYAATNTALVPSYLSYPNPNQPVKGGSQPYTATWIATTLTSQLTQIDITVSYTYKGQTHTNNATIYKNEAM